MLLIDHDQPEIFDWSKYSAAGANNDLGLPVEHFLPFVMTFAGGKVAVKDGDLILYFRKTGFKTIGGLWSQRNFGNENDGASSLIEAVLNCLKVDFSFSTSSDPVEENRFGRFFPV